MRKKPFRIRSICWEGNNTCRLMANQALRALGSRAQFDRKREDMREKRIEHRGREINLSIHGVWRPIEGVGGLSKGLLEKTDLLLVPTQNMFYPGGKSFRKPAELWDNQEAVGMLREHEREGRVVVVDAEMSDAELEREIRKRLDR